MHLLVIGGTVFLGRHIVLEALASGHKVTTLNRGTHVLPEQENVEKLIDDRERDLDILTGRKFDAVIDVCGYKPEVVAQSAEILKNAVETYLFVSTISVYGSFEKIGLNESDPIKNTTLEKPGDYGTFKADCEKVLQEIVPEKALIVRPGLIVGPFDPTDRFTYWPARIARGGKVVAPGKPGTAMQFIDVRDLARWLLELTEKKERGIYNATGPRQRLSLGEFLESSNRALKGNCEFIWINDENLEKEQVQSFADLPFWIPSSVVEYAGFQQIDCGKALKAGIQIRPLEQTVRDTAAWHQEHRSKAGPLAVGISPERERELIEKYS